MIVRESDKVQDSTKNYLYLFKLMCKQKWSNKNKMINTQSKIHINYKWKQPTTASMPYRGVQTVIACASGCIFFSFRTVYLCHSQIGGLFIDLYCDFEYMNQLLLISVWERETHTHTSALSLTHAHIFYTLCLEHWIRLNSHSLYHHKFTFILHH